MSNEQDKVLIARSRQERRKNLNKLFDSLQAAKNMITIFRPFSKSKWLVEVLEYLDDVDQTLTLLFGAGWLNGETSQGEYEAKKSDDITALTVSRELRLGLLNAHAAQIETTGKTLAWILARLNGESFPGVLAGVPSKDELVDLLGGVYEQLGAINKVAVLMQRGHVLNAQDMDETAKQWFEDRCREVINETKASDKVARAYIKIIRSHLALSHVDTKAEVSL
jgi:hypothetical protein